MIPEDWEKPAVQDGMRRMLALRAARVEAGERAIGWKLGFGAPSSLEKFDLSGPLVGFLIESALHRPGSHVSVEGWQHPVAEPELAVHIAEDIPAGSTDIDDAILGFAAAIELADVYPPPGDIAEVLGGNIYHRAVITDLDRTQLVSVRDLRATVHSGDEVVAEVSDLEALTGDLYRVIGHCADLLAASGEILRAGDIVIAGSVIPPVLLSPGDILVFEVDGLPDVSVRV